MKAFPTRIIAAVLMLATATAAAGENFRVVNMKGERARRIEAAAETAYVENATWWFGKRFPDLWKPVRIHARFSGGTGGTTTFSFDRGEVFDWRMTLQGTERGILDDAVPHEVNHVVFAARFRRPLPRCLDEGAAQMMESPAEHERRRKRVAAAIAQGRVLPFAFALDTRDYPREMSATLTLYAQCHSLVEYLLQEKGRQTFVEFVADKRKPTEKLRTFYGSGPAELQARWAEWFRRRSKRGFSCQAFGCPRHTAAKPPAKRQIVYAFTAGWCRNCRPFKRDVTAGKFPEFDVRYVDPDKTPRLWREVTARMVRETGHRGGIPLPSWWVPGGKRLIVMKPYSAPGLVQILGGIIRGIGRLFHNPDAGATPAHRGPPSPAADLRSLRSDVAATMADVGRFKEAGIVGKAVMIPKLKRDFAQLVEDKKRLAQDLVAVRTESRAKIGQLKTLLQAVMKAIAGDLKGLGTLKQDLAAVKDADGFVARLRAGAKVVADLKAANAKLHDQVAAGKAARKKLQGRVDAGDESLKNETEFGPAGWLLGSLGVLLGTFKGYIGSKLG